MKKNDSVLFTPLRIGGVTMKNRFEAAPGLPQSEQSLRNLIFTAERAAGGSGLVCLGEAVVHARTGYCHKNNITLDDEDNATTLMELADTIRRYGALSSVQLIHSGRRANPSHLVGGDRVYGPSAGDGVYGNKVYELTEELIEEIVEAFAHGAMLARYSGLDMVMVHAAHGWLPHQFLSPLNNRRGDRFGGSIENRARFLLMIIDRIKRACGNDYPVDVRISGAELYEGGYGVDDMVELAKLIDGKADMIHVSASTFHNRDGMVRLYPSQYAEHGLNVEYAAKIKAAVGIPVAVVGAMDLPELMEEAVSSGKADVVVLGRALLADEQIPKKMLAKRQRDITPCIRCQYCVSGGFVPYVRIVRGTMRCSVNPGRGREYEKLFARRSTRKKALVIGGGPAGMEAAIAASEFGHDVVLCEKSGSLGGMLKAAGRLRFKSDIRRFLDVMTYRVGTHPVDVRLNTEVTPEMADCMDVDAIICAIGAEPVVPPIPGIERAIPVHLLHGGAFADGARRGQGGANQEWRPRGADLARNEQVGANAARHERAGGEAGAGARAGAGAGEARTGGAFADGDRVAIIGGGLAGIEEAIGFAREGRQVTVVEMTGDIARGAPYILYRSTVLETQKYPNLTVLTDTACVEVTERGVKVRTAAGRVEELAAEAVVCAAGFAPRHSAAEAFRGCTDEYHAIGDCRCVGQVLGAMGDGYDAACRL